MSQLLMQTWSTKTDVLETKILFTPNLSHPKVFAQKDEWKADKGITYLIVDYHLTTPTNTARWLHYRWTPKVIKYIPKELSKPQVYCANSYAAVILWWWQISNKSDTFHLQWQSLYIQQHAANVYNNIVHCWLYGQHPLDSFVLCGVNSY